MKKGKDDASSARETGSPDRDTANVEHLPPPIKSSEDEKEYSVIQLANGVVATIISTREAEVTLEERTSNGAEGLAACAVTVKVGSFDDPDDTPGLAHLLEHVLTSGSDKYPEESQFDLQLGSNCGSHDATADCEWTTFFFDCRNSALRKTMAMFARCFVAPALSWDAVRRERQSIDSEFAENARSDNARRIQLICSCASDNSPALKFSWGNLKTLGDSKEKLLNSVKEFNRIHYTGSHLKVAVQANMSVKKLEQLVCKGFTDVPIAARPRHSVSFQVDQVQFDMSKFCRIYSVQSTSFVSELILNWVLRPLADGDGTKPLEYLSYVLGAEGEGSIIHQLRSQGMALFLTAEVEEGGLSSNSHYTIFTICATITEAGRRSISLIIRTVFEYLKMLQVTKASPVVYEELKSIADTNFKYRENLRAIDTVVAVSQKMLTFPSEQFLTGSSIFADFDGTNIDEYLASLTPSTVNVMLYMKSHERVLDQEERWFKTKYRVDPIPTAWLHGWEAATPTSDFSLPRPNAYLPTEFGLVNTTTTFVPPEKLVVSQSCEVWHKRENVHRLPTGSVHLLIHTPVGTVEDAVCRTLVIKMLAYQMIEELFYVHVAGIEHKIQSVERGIEIHVLGFSHKIPEVFEVLSTGFTQFKDKFDDKLFQDLKTELERTTLNVMQNGAALCTDLRKSVMSEKAYTGGEKYERVGGITKQQLIDCSLFGDVFVQALVRGNLSRETAKTMIEKFAASLGGSDQAAVVEPGKRIPKQLPQGTSTIKVHTFNGEDINCYTELHCQFGPASAQEAVALQLIITAMKKPLSNELRLKIQLGYSLSVNPTDISGVLGLVITVYSQVDKFSADNAQSLIHTFLAQFLTSFQAMSSDQYNDLRSVYLDRVRIRRPFQLRDDALADWLEIKNHRYEFDRQDKGIAEVAQLDKSIVDAVAERLLGGEGRMLVTQVVGHRPKNHGLQSQPSYVVDDQIVYNHVPDSTGTSITNFIDWKKSLPNY